MARRFAAAIGIVVLLGLALTLLYRVYRHHENTAPYNDDEMIEVRGETTAPPAVNFAEARL
jgi:hypothetical protein